MPILSQTELARVAADRNSVPIFDPSSAARRSEGVLGELGDPTADRYTLFDIGGNAFVKETLPAGVRLMFIPHRALPPRRLGVEMAMPLPQAFAGIRVVDVLVRRTLPESSRLPYAFRFVPSRLLDRGSEGSGVRGLLAMPRIEITAAPGVSVAEREHDDLRSAFNDYVGELERLQTAGANGGLTLLIRNTAALEIQRVQDPELVPVMGEEPPGTELVLEAIAIQKLPLPGGETAELRPTFGRTPSIVPAYHVSDRPDGANLNFFPRRVVRPPATAGGLLEALNQHQADLSTRAVNAHAPFTLELRVPLDAADARVCWAIRPLWDSARSWEVTVVRTANVTAKVASEPQMVDGFGLNVSYRELVVPFEFAGSVDVPENVIVETRTKPGAVFSESWILAVELGLGFSPLDSLADLADLVSYRFSGTDKWGNSMSRLDLAFILLGLGLPGMTAGAARVMFRRGRELATEVGKAADALSTAERKLLSDESAGVSGRLAQAARGAPPGGPELLSRAWAILTESAVVRRLKLRSALGQVMRWMPPDPRYPATAWAFDDLIQLGSESLWIPDLQRKYRRYLDDIGEGTALSPRRWLAEGAPDDVRKSIRSLLGEDAWIVETATLPADYIRALRREAARIGGAPRNEFGRSWDWDRFPQRPEGYRWRHGDPIDAPRTKKGDYPPYGTSQKRANQNLAFFELQRLLGRTFDSPPTKAELWQMLKEGDLLASTTRKATYNDPEFIASPIELVLMYDKGTAGVEKAVWRGADWASNAVAPGNRISRDVSRARGLARLELLRRHPDRLEGKATPSEIREALEGAREGLGAGLGHPPRAIEHLPDEDLVRTLEVNASPFSYQVFELEHVEVPQRATDLLDDAFELSEAAASSVRRFTRASSPGNLLFATLNWHGWLDFYRGKSVTDVKRLETVLEDGSVRPTLDVIRETDERMANPYARMRNADLVGLWQLVNGPGLSVKNAQKADLARQQLRDMIKLRNLSI